MPNCFQLYHKATPEAGPVPLNQIDRELCNFMSVEVHPQWYAFGWYNWIGFLLAMGKDWNGIRECLPDWRDEEDRIEANQIIDWFEEFFTTECWVEVG